MAQTRTITPRKLAAIGALDFVSRALHGVWRPPPPRPGLPKSFLVVEPWGIGDDLGGGAHLLTDVLPSRTQNDHKVSDWQALLEPLGVSERSRFQPSLTVTEGERANARRRLRMAGLSTEKPIVGVHTGASQ